MQSRNGSVLLFVAIGMIVLLSLFALVVDAGSLYTERSRMVNAVDAGALAGVTALPGNTTNASSRAKWYARQNVSDLTDSNIQVTFETYGSVSNGRINVTATKDVSLTFARFFGLSSTPVAATASAGLRGYSGGSGVLPFAIDQATLGTPTPGTQYVLKYGAGIFTEYGTHSHGNFGALDITRTQPKYSAGNIVNGTNGANGYKANVMNGSAVPLVVGDQVYTEPGNMAGPTDTAIDYRIGLDPTATFETVSVDSPRVVIIPVVDKGVGDLQGKDITTIVGFAAFFLEGFDSDKSGKNAYVFGRFMNTIVVPGIPGSSGTNYGVYTYSLVN